MLITTTAKTSPEHPEPGTSQKYEPQAYQRLMRFQFKENPDAWLLVDKILQEATYPQTKCEPVSDLIISSVPLIDRRHRPTGLG